MENSRYPSLGLSLEQGFAASRGDLNFTQLSASLSQQLDAGNKGNFRYYLGGGTFLNADRISFVDYQHFNGNQTRVNLSDKLQSFNILPYYLLSTNKNYFEGHIEHNFQGYLLGKIPGIRALNLNLVAGAKALSIEGNKPYTELSLGVDNLGFGKFKFLRIEYVRSFYQANQDGAFVFGLTF